MQARPRLGSLGQACGLRGALDGAVHADKDICMVASREARFSGSLLGLLTSKLLGWPAAQLLGFLFRRVELPRRLKRRSTSLLVAGDVAAPARICCTASSILLRPGRLAKSIKRTARCSSAVRRAALLLSSAIAHAVVAKVLLATCICLRKLLSWPSNL